MEPVVVSTTNELSKGIHTSVENETRPPIKEAAGGGGAVAGRAGQREEKKRTKRVASSSDNNEQRFTRRLGLFQRIDFRLYIHRVGKKQVEKPRVTLAKKEKKGKKNNQISVYEMTGNGSTQARSTRFSLVLFVLSKITRCTAWVAVAS